MEADNIKMTTFVTPPENSHVHVDHNLYIKDGYVYQVSVNILVQSLLGLAATLSQCNIALFCPSFY